MAIAIAIAIGLIVAGIGWWSYRPEPEYLAMRRVPLPTLDIDRSPIGDESCDGIEIIEEGS